VISVFVLSNNVIFVFVSYSCGYPLSEYPYILKYLGILTYIHG
jgi:hypothetical protein